MTVIFPEVEKLKQLLQPLQCRYWIAGGWAIDLFLNRQTRLHKDIEVAIARADQKHLLPLPNVSSIEYIENHEAKTWRGAALELPVHELHAHFYGGGEIEFLLNEFDDANWIYRRNKDIRYPRAKFDNLPYLPPEIVLLYKSKDPRREDEKDFAAAQDRLAPAERQWLHESIAQSDPKHPWIAALKQPSLSGSVRGKF